MLKPRIEEFTIFMLPWLLVKHDTDIYWKALDRCRLSTKRIIIAHTIFFDHSRPAGHYLATALWRLDVWIEKENMTLARYMKSGIGKF